MKKPLKESWVKQEIKKILKVKGAVYCMPATYGLGRSGCSDFIACYKGYFIAIEAKAGTGKTTALQDRWLESVIKADGYALVINENNLSDIEAILGIIDRDPNQNNR